MPNEFVEKHGLKVNEKILGLAGLLQPFSDKISSARLMMFFNNLFQYLVLEKAEFPKIYTGFEFQLADHSISASADLDDDVEILKIIPKFSNIHTELNPLYTIIYRNLETNKISYFNLYGYFKFQDGYGFRNEFINLSMLEEGNIVPKGTEFTKSVNILDNGAYAMGTNVNIAYISNLDTFEDSLTISEDLAKRLESYSIRTITVGIDFDKYPLNLYGDDNVYKVFPDIGETVRDDGILCAFRKINKQTLMTDLNRFELNKVNLMHDKIYKVKPGAKVIDVNVYIDDIKLLKTVYDQFIYYNNHLLKYYREIYETYKKYKDYELDYRFNTLVTRAMEMLMVNSKVDGVKRPSNVRLTHKDEQVRLLAEITIAYNDTITEGNKLTGRDGAKGIIGNILPNDCMPVDEEGNRADLVIDIATVIKRTNLTQLYEQFLTRLSDDVVKKRIKTANDVNTKFNILMEYLNDINPNYKDLVKEAYKGKEHILIDEVEKDGINLFIPPTFKNIDTNLVLKLAEKYGLKASKVKFKIPDDKDGWKEVVSKEPVFIGSKYILLLYNKPDAHATNVAIINQYRLPTKTSKQKILDISMSPIKFGEDEFRILMNTCIPEEVARMKMIHAFSKKGLEEAVYKLLTRDNIPNLDRLDITTRELLEDSYILKILVSYFELTGIEIKNIKKPIK